MKLYFAPGACSLSPHIALQEAGLAYTAVRADLKTKELDGGGDFKAKNPLGMVPALELDDGTILTEGPAIVQYIADKAPAKNLAPANGTLERYQLQSWLNFTTSEMHKAIGSMFNPAMPEEAKKQTKEKLVSRMTYLEKHLTAHPYLMGKTYSIADGYLFNVLLWTKPTGIDLTPYPHILAFQKRIGERPAVQAAMKAEGLLK
jgi:glutathione S-transferase